MGKRESGNSKPIPSPLRGAAHCAQALNAVLCSVSPLTLRLPAQERLRLSARGAFIIPLNTGNYKLRLLKNKNFLEKRTLCYCYCWVIVYHRLKPVVLNVDQQQSQPSGVIVFGSMSNSHCSSPVGTGVPVELWFCWSNSAIFSAIVSSYLFNHLS